MEEEAKRGKLMVCWFRRVWFWDPIRTRLSCVARSSRLDPLFAEISRHLAGILGESSDSGLSLSLDGRSILAVLSPCQEGWRWAVQGRGARFENRADNRRFRVRFCFAS